MITLIILLITFFRVLKLRRSDPSPDVTMGDVLRREITKVLFKKKGRGGAAYVRGVLKRLGDEYVVLNDLTFHGESGKAEIDHLVVSPYGIFVIETEDDNGNLYGSEQAELWTQRIGEEEHTISNPIQQNEEHVMVLRQLLGDMPFIPIEAFVGKAELQVVLDKAVIAGCYELISTIHSYTEVLLSPEEQQQALWQIQSLDITKPVEADE